MYWPPNNQRRNRQYFRDIVLETAFALLYADDTALISERPNELQNQLNSFQNYSEVWKLKVNVEKTKVVCFGSGRLPANLDFRYNGESIEIVKHFNYLGILLNRTGNFNIAIKAQANKGTRAMYEVLKQGKTHGLSIECQIDLFDKIVKPILLYGSEIWGFSNIHDIEKVHLRFCKLLLNLKMSTPNCVVYGELHVGRYPLTIEVKLRMITYWIKLVIGKEAKLCSIVYRLMYHYHNTNNANFKWLTTVKSIFDECGLSYVWTSQLCVNHTWIKAQIKQSLIDQFRQVWNEEIQTSPKTINYRLFKDTLELEKYFNILDKKNYIIFCKFRTINHKLPIETGRWQNIERQNRKCTLCNTDIGDEYHYILNCPSFINERKNYIKKRFYERPNTIFFKEIMSSENGQSLINLCKFIKIINKRVVPPS